MSKPLVIDKAGNVEDFDFVVASRALTHIGMLSNVDPSSVTYKANMNAADELSFTVYKTFNGVQQKYWDKITDLRLIYIPSLDEYFEMDVLVDDANETGTNKQVTGTSLCEAELGQTMLYNIEINTEDDIKRESYIVTKFYNADNPKGSLLNRVLDKAPHYKIGHVDESLKNMQRSFSIDGSSIYDFLTGDCAEQFNCLFTFDSATRTINAYDLYTVCRSCGHRGEFNDKCPQCGSTDLYVYGEDTTIYIDKENLTDDIQLDVDMDSIKNTFHLVAGDDNMTAAIRNINPSGSDYLYYFSKQYMEDMSPELQQKIKQYQSTYQGEKVGYKNLTTNIYTTIDDIINLQSKMMPKMSDVVTDSKKEAAKIQQNLKVVAIDNMSKSTSIATVNSAIKNLCKTYIKSGYFKVEIPVDQYNQTTAGYQYQGKDSDGQDYGIWTGEITVTNYSDEENDVTTTPEMTVKVTGMYEEYLKEKIDKQMASVGKDSDKDNSDYLGVVQVMNQDLDKLKESLKQYCLTLLNSYHDALEGALGIMQAEGHGQVESDYYQSMYLPYYNKMLAVQQEIDTRDKQIEEKQKQLQDYENQRTKIQKKLNFRSFVGEDLYKEFCAFRREDEYSNDNFTSDDLDNAEIFKRADEFMKDAQEEIVKAGEPQYSLSSTLNNLLVIPEFAPIVDHFDIGNWMRFGVDGLVFRLRLTSYTINFSDLTTLQVEFSSLTNTVSGANDVKSILDSAQSMATSYSYVAKQADKGDDADEELKDLRTNSLNAALYRITNNDQEEVSYDRHGILSRQYDDVEGVYGPEQLKITHNIMAFTDDNWKTTKAAVGKQQYTLNGVDYTGYGVNADFVLAGTVVGGDIYSDNYSSTDKTGTHFDLRTGSFSLAGQKIVYTASNNSLILDGVSLVSGTTIGESTVASAEDISNNGVKILKQANEYTDTKVSDSNNALTQKWVFNRITNNGNYKALYMGTDSNRNDQLYINADYIKSGTLHNIPISYDTGQFSLNSSGKMTASNAEISNSTLDNVTITNTSLGDITTNNITASGTIKQNGKSLIPSDGSISNVSTSVNGNTLTVSITVGRRTYSIEIPEE